MVIFHSYVSLPEGMLDLHATLQHDQVALSKSVLKDEGLGKSRPTDTKIKTTHPAGRTVRFAVTSQKWLPSLNSEAQFFYDQT